MHDKTKIINHKMFALDSSSIRRELLVEKQTGLFLSITFWPNYSNNFVSLLPVGSSQWKCEETERDEFRLPCHSCSFKTSQKEELDRRQ